MPKNYPIEVKDREVRMLREHEGDYGPLAAACVPVGGRLGIVRETLRSRVEQPRIDEGDKPGTTTTEPEEIRVSTKENRRPREANKILCSIPIFFARELDPHHR